MSLVADKNLTLADFATRTDEKGNPAEIAEVANEENGLLSRLIFKPSSGKYDNRVVVRNGLPTTNIRRVNQATAPSKSTTSVIRDTMTIFEQKMRTDRLALEMEGNGPEHRRIEGRAHMEALTQRITKAFLYGDPSLIEDEFTGLTPRYNDRNGNAADNILSASVTPSGTDNSSIWLVGVGEGKIYATYPRELPVAGMRHIDLPLQEVPGELGLDGATLTAYTDIYEWATGLVVKDWRYAGRVCNVKSNDALNLTTDQELTDYGTNIRYRMSELRERVKDQGVTQFYLMPRRLKAALKKMGMATTNANVFDYDTIDGRRVTHFEDVEVLTLDQLTYTEAFVANPS